MAKDQSSGNKTLDKGISNKVTEAWVLQDYYIQINDQELCDSDIVDFEQILGGCENKARLAFVDSKGIMTGDKEKAGHLGVGGFVTVGYTSGTGCKWEGKFTISKIKSENNERNQKLVQLDLVDHETRNMQGTFVSKGYPDKKFSEVIDKHYKDNGNIKKLVVAAPKKIKELKANIVIPGNINFHNFVKKEAKHRGFNFIKDKFHNYLVHNEHLEFGSLMQTELVYEFDAPQYSFSRIVQYNIDGFDMDAYLASFPKSTTSIDDTTNNSKDTKDKGTSTKISQKKAKDSKADGNIGGTMISKLTETFRGIKQGVKPMQDKQYFNALNNLQGGTIWVPGQNSNLVGKKITVIFPKPNHYKGDDSMFSGIFEVVAVRDKIIGWYFMQELMIRKSADSGAGGTNAPGSGGGLNKNQPPKAKPLDILKA